MDTTFSACDAGRDGPGWRERVSARLREDGLAVLAGITGRAALTALARELMTIRPHRDAAPDGVTEITDTGAAAAGYAAFTGAGLIPHTDGTAVADPPQLLLLACVRPAGEGGATLVADGARVAAALAGRHPGALPALSAPKSAWFGTPADGYLGAVCEPAGPGRMRLRLRLDDLARFSPDAACAVPALRAAISANAVTLRLGPGDGVVLCNTRWLHGREPYAGRRVMLRIRGAPRPGAGICRVSGAAGPGWSRLCQPGPPRAQPARGRSGEPAQGRADRAPGARRRDGIPSRAAAGVVPGTSARDPAAGRPGTALQPRRPHVRRRGLGPHGPAPRASRRQHARRAGDRELKGGP